MRKKVISVVGWHNVGKTTFVARLVSALKARGLHIATIKHSREGFSLDREGTDTWHFAQAGSDIVGIISREGLALIERPPEEPTLEEIVARLPDYIDLVITEGYKRAATPKIEVLRGGMGEGRIARDDELLAVITDGEVLSGGAPHYAPGDIAGVVALLEARGFIPASAPHVGALASQAGEQGQHGHDQ